MFHGLTVGNPQLLTVLQVTSISLIVNRPIWLIRLPRHWIAITSLSANQLVIWHMQWPQSLLMTIWLIAITMVTITTPVI